VITSSIDCVIERRLLVNYRIDPGKVAALLPGPFRPQLVSDHAVAGVCFIRMSRIRPAHLPRATGLTTENVAHRFAVEWDDAEGTHVGVYVPRRETSSRLTVAVGGHVFPGAYHLARFHITESEAELCIDVRSRDGKVSVSAEAVPAAAFTSELFPTLGDAIDFFRHGCLGFSPAAVLGCMDSVRLHSTSWAARPMTISRMRSSLYDDAALFPSGACKLDSALLMTNIAARWTADRRHAHSERAAAGLKNHTAPAERRRWHDRGQDPGGSRDQVPAPR
jgi:hypothetical protein